jgi:tetratricopeptide (TPR) repeat protein
MVSSSQPTMGMAPSDRRMESPILVGRAQPQQALGRALEAGRGGRGQVLLLAGEAGIGKSRLIAEARSNPAAQAFLMLQGNCFEPDRVMPYAPLLDLLRAFIAAGPPEQVSRCLAPTAQELVKLLPELATLLPDVAPSSPLESEPEKRRLFQALARFFTGLATEQPVLVIVEDLHWSDDTSLEFLTFLSRRVPAHPIVLILTYRNDQVQPALRHFLAELDRERLATEAVLARLTPDEVDTMLQAIFDLKRSVRAEFLDVIYGLTEGNPFFIEEILKSLITAGEIFYADGTWDRKPMNELHIPRRVEDAVQRRSEQLGSTTKQVLTLAAVTGRRFDFALLEALTGMNERELLPLIKELIAAQLVVEESADQFAFRHALTREAVYSTLLVRERKRHHQTIAQTIERIYPNTLDSHLADLAYHSYAGGEWGKASEYSQRAGEKAQALNAPREAIGYFTRALDAAEKATIPPPVNLYRARGQAFETVGDFQSARSDYEHALGAAHAPRDPVAEWQSLIDLGFLWAGQDYQRTGDFFQRATALAQNLGDPKLHADSLNRWGNWLGNIGQPEPSLQIHLQALEIFEEQQDKEGTADTHDLLGMANLLYGDYPNAHKHYARAIELYRELSDKRGLASSLSVRNGLAFAAEPVFSPVPKLEDYRRDSAEALNLARQIGWQAGEAFVEWHAGASFGAFGEFGQGLSHAREALRIATEIGHRQWTVAAYFALGHVFLLMLQAEGALENLTAGLPLARELGSAWWTGHFTTELALAYLLESDFQHAEEVLNAGLPEDQPPHNLTERRMTWAWGELEAARGRHELALQIAERLISSAPGARRDQPIPDLLHLKGRTLIAVNRQDDAEQALEAAKRGALERGNRPLLWQIHRSHGALYQQVKRGVQAESEFAAARKLVESLAATVEDLSLRESFRRAALETLPREKLITARHSAKKEFGGLTEREREVTRLIAQGKSNHEIADALVVNKRTIETHVSSVLSKLGFRTRAQIIAWAIQKGLVKGSE